MAHERRLLGLREELGDRAVERAALPHPHPDEPLGAQRLGAVGEAVELVAAVVGRRARHPQALDRPRRRERLELRRREHLGELDELHAEAQVGLVDAVPVHRLVPRDLRDLAGPLAQHRLRRVEHRLGHGRQHLVLGDEAGLHVELHELELPVGAQVLVPQAAGDLVVAIGAAHHQELLEQLRRLRERVEAAGHEARRHEELAGALGRRRHQHRRLDLDEALPLHRAAEAELTVARIRRFRCMRSRRRSR